MALVIGSLCLLIPVFIIHANTAQGNEGPKIGVEIVQDSLSVVAERKAPFLLNCSVNSDPEFSPSNYTWIKDGKVVEENGRVKILKNGTLAFRRIVHKKGKRVRSPERRSGRSDSGWYECYAGNKVGTIFVRRVKLEVAEVVKRIETRPEKQIRAVGGVARFECGIDGAQDTRLLWEKVERNTDLNGPRFKKFSGILQITNLQLSDSGSYRCLQLSQSTNLKMSSEAELTVQGVMKGKPPEIIAGPSNTTINTSVKKTAILECLAEGNPKPRVTWRRKDSSPIENAEKTQLGNLEIHDVTARHDGDYICTATNELGSDSRSAFLEVIVPPVINTQPTSDTHSYALDFDFKCDAKGKPTPSLRWLKDGKELENGSRIWIDYNGRLLVRGGELEDSGYYQCIVENSAGYATLVSRALVLRADGSPTNPPRDVKVTVISETVVRITWLPPAPPSPPPTSYTISRNIMDETERPQDYFNIELTQETSFMVQGLKPYTKFAFHVRAFNSKGASPASEVVYATTEESVPITYPKITNLSTPTPNSIQVTWKPLTKAEARGKVDHYMIFYRWNSTTKSAKVSADRTSHILTHTHPNTIYSIRVLGATAKGYPDMRKLSQPWEKITTPRQPSQNGNLYLEVSRLNNSAISVSWRVLSQEDEVSGFQVFLERAVGREQLGPFHVPPSQNSSVFTKLENNTWYEVTVVAFSKLGVSWTETKSISTRSPMDLPPPPQELDGEALSASSIKVTWKPPPTEMTIDFYTVNYTVSSSLDLKPNLTNSKTVQSTSQGVVIKGLKPYTSYRISVQSHAKGISGEFSNPLVVRTAEGVPSAPEDVEWTLKTPTEIRISWSPPRNSNGKIVSYEINYTEKQKENWKRIVENGSASSHSVKELFKKEYLFKVRAVTSKGAGNFSSILPVMIPGQHSTVVPTTEDPYVSPAFKMKWVIIICLVIAAVVIIIFVLVIIVRYRCFNACCRGQAHLTHSNHRPQVCTGNGNLTHHGSHHANGHAVQVPSDEVQLDTYLNILPTLPENENLDAKGGGNVVVRPPGFKNGFTMPNDYHNGHMHNNIHAVEEDKVREPLLSRMRGESKVPEGRSPVSKERTLGDSLEDIDHGDADVSQGVDEVDLDDSSTPLVSKSARSEEAKSTRGTTTSPSGGALDLRRGDNRVIERSAEPKGIGTPSKQGRASHGDSQKGAESEAGSGEDSQAGGRGASVAAGRFSGSSLDEPSLPLSEYQSNQTSHHSQVGGAGSGLAPPSLAPPPLTGSTRPPSSDVTFTSTSVPQGMSQQQQQQQPAVNSSHHTSNLSDSMYSQRLPGPAADLAAFGQPHIATATGVPSGHTGNAGLTGDVELSLKPSDLALPLAAVSDGMSTTTGEDRRPQASA